MNGHFGDIPSSGLVWAIPGLPLIGFVCLMVGGGPLIRLLGQRAGKRLIGGFATVLVLGAMVVTLVVLADLLRLAPEHRRVVASLVPGLRGVPWLQIGPVDVRYEALIDPLSVLMCLIVTGVGGLIHLYATGYMSGDRDYARFFAYFNLFIVAMLVLVLGESILMLFVGWEGVGLCSYLLISFWYEDTENAKAGNKAFIVNRIGDVGFILGIMAVLATFGTMSFRTAEGTGFLDMASQRATLHGVLTSGTATLIALLLFVGACGKSAQFPLHVWLPDAMAGPTPVSALIHAATMVTAGVVMVTRMSPLFVQAPGVMMLMAAVGLFTALFAATIALTQTDIKKVLAYSTVSQLGFMFLGCGVGAFAAGMFHVTTHAFFKALLFLGAGSVIHGLSGVQDLRRMGGLTKLMPITYWTMVAGWVAIAGFPGAAGFWSKDLILGVASGAPKVGPILYAVGTFTAFLTGLYMTRLMAKAFWTASRRQDDAQGHGVHESPPSMWVPLAILAALALAGGWIGVPWADRFGRFLAPSVASPALLSAHEGIAHGTGLLIGSLVALAAMACGILAYRAVPKTGELLPQSVKERNPLYLATRRLWFVDDAATGLGVTAAGRAATAAWRYVDKGLVDGSVNAVGFITGLLSEIGRGSQTGYVRTYVMTMLAGIVAILIAALWLGAGR